MSSRGPMCVERCRWDKVYPGVSCWPVPGEATSPSIQTAGVGKDLLDLKGEKRTSRVWWSWYSGVPSLASGWGRVGEDGEVGGVRRKCCDLKGVLGKWPNAAAWT